MYVEIHCPHAHQALPSVVTCLKGLLAQHVKHCSFHRWSRIGDPWNSPMKVTVEVYYVIERE